MLAMTQKEFRQLRRDRRTVVMMLGMPLLLLVVFGYAASFNVSELTVEVLGPQAEQLAPQIEKLDEGQKITIEVTEVDVGGTRTTAEDDLREGKALVAVVTGGQQPLALIDGSQLFAAQAALTGMARAPIPIETEVLFNPDLETSVYMVPAIIGLILVFIGTMITSLGVVKEREAGTLEQLAVMPLGARDIISGKLLPYFIVGIVDLVAVTVVAVALFDVPFRGPIWQFALGGALFLVTTMSFGVLISTVSQNQGQAIQLALMVTLPQVLLSGMIFPLESMAPGVRWIAYILPLTYFVEIARDVMIKGTPLTSFWEPYVGLLALGGAVFLVAILRFQRDLGAKVRVRRRHRSDPVVDEAREAV